MKVLRRSRFVIVVKFVMTTSSFGIIIRDKNNVKIRSFPAKFNLANAKAARVMTTNIMAVVTTVKNKVFQRYLPRETVVKAST